MRYVVGPAATFRDGERRVVKAGSRSIGVFRVGERFFAVRNRCPHQGAPLCLGPLVPRMASTGPGDMAIDAERPMISCPWHGWEYDLASGESFVRNDPGTRSYATALRPGTDLADARIAEPEPAPGPTAGPYTVETFTVTVDDRDYVVLEL